MKIAFIGLGRMGRGMAQRILGGGHDLAVYDAISAQAEPLAAAGARAAASVADVCAGRAVVVTMLVEDAAVLDIASRPGGLCDSLPKGAIHLAMGTYGVGAIRALASAHAAAGQVLVAAPVLGRPDLAASGQLGIVSGGPDEAVRVCAPCSISWARTFHAGPLPESATAIKLANNMLLGCAMVAMAEGLSLVRGYDVAPATFYDIIAQGLFAGSPAYTGYGKTMVDESWDTVGSPIGRPQGRQPHRGRGRHRARADAEPQRVPRSVAGRRGAWRWRPGPGRARARAGARQRTDVARPFHGRASRG
jgi:3-hydroxyisobutyrate dehydrogenase-like beta-hydroxyacid dehydrogenase